MDLWRLGGWELPGRDMQLPRPSTGHGRPARTVEEEGGWVKESADPGERGQAGSGGSERASGVVPTLLSQSALCSSFSRLGRRTFVTLDVLKPHVPAQQG